MTKTLPNPMVLAAALLLSVAACGDDKSDPKPSGGKDGGAEDAGAGSEDAGGGNVDIADARDRVKAKLTSCNVVEANSPIDLALIGSPSDLCSANCIADASCEELSALVCDSSSGGALGTCRENCLFKCTKGTTDDLTYQCDGFDDCADASDEAGCSTYYFTCANGDKTNLLFKCDGEPDCEDSSDERSCPDQFKCTNGDRIPASFRCDGFDGCGDNSDEVDCGTVCQ